ncbi:beta-ketoacyl-ACP synthase III [Rappaport israeli]|uniref:beta-ketoacyl-ACP synthase III n=1 Tax=Rappaport israeli TaxID=1839807 RepID=UPI000930FFF1|nr:beta-ketoacyl-ACP synthase III [Rappaport israeli]
MTFSKILATGAYLPEKILTNQDLTQYFDTSDEWIRTRTGIEQRHIAAKDQSSTDLAYLAALDALESANLNARELDLIIVATSTAEHHFPSNASQLQHRLGCRNIAAFDIQAVCSGFVYALNIADNFIRAKQAKRVLVVGAELFSNVLDWSDRGTAILFGDGAGACILEASSTPGIHGSVLHADGEQKELLWIPNGIGSPACQRQTRSPHIHMQGREVFKVAVRTLANLVNELLESCQISIEDIDFLVPHQANLRIIKSTAEHLKLPMEKVIVTVNKHANTSAASVPLALDYAIKNKIIKRGDNLILEAFGGGFTWGGSIITY